MMAGCLHTRHFEPTLVMSETTRDDRTNLDDVVGIEETVAGHKRAVADDEMRFTVQPEFGEERVHTAAAGDLDLAGRIAQQHPHRARQRASRRGVDGA